MRLTKRYFFWLLITSASLITTTAWAQMVTVYVQPNKADYQAASESFRRGQLLERISGYINSRVRMPGNVRLVAAECGGVRAFYDPQRRAVVICYELMENIATGVVRDFPGSNQEQIADISAGAIFFILYHELGHALIHLLNLPVIAREEDAADAIGTFFILNSPNRVPAVIGATWFFRQKGMAYTARHFGNEHSLDEQRQLNIICHALGSNAQTFGPMAERLSLPSERAQRCPSEYARLDSSVRRLLGSHLRY